MRKRQQELFAEEDTVETERRKWYLGKEIPVAVVLAMTVQTVVGAMWIGGQVKAFEIKLDQAITQIQNLEKDRYTKEDARKDQALILQILEQFRQTDRENERRILACEKHYGDVRDKK